MTSINPRPQVGDHIQNKSKAGHYTIDTMEGRGNARKALCGHTQYFVTNLALVSAGGTKKYPKRTWRYIGPSNRAKK